MELRVGADRASRGLLCLAKVLQQLAPKATALSTVVAAEEVRPKFAACRVLPRS